MSGHLERGERIAAALIARLHAFGWSGVIVDRVTPFDERNPRYLATGATPTGEVFEHTGGSADGAIYGLAVTALEVAEAGL